MFFPWIGLFEQIRLADVYIHYDDVQFPQGRSFTNRVEIKTLQGIQWLTVPVLKKGKGLQLIRDVEIDDSQNWREKHIRTLRTNYAKAAFLDDMLKIVNDIYKMPTKFLCDLNMAAIENISSYFGINRIFLRSSEHETRLKSSHHLLELVRRAGGDIYITGHGARNYLHHELFEENHIRVEYMDYQRGAYPQLYGSFDPHVSILDLIANVGVKGRDVICSQSMYWKEFIKQ
jgi:hypothetical protein